MERNALMAQAQSVFEFMTLAAAVLILIYLSAINLVSLAIIGGVIGVGLGLWLQRTGSKFISDVDRLVENQASVGDNVARDGSDAGTIIKLAARAAILETFAGRWIVVSNENFITPRVAQLIGPTPT
ncbi:hypothetical protein [Yoonia algicola]|uniref:Uncharacterized protein n=1 Tax=Yoonia algicola TaxID=3137368 RepID=A0AAN0NGU6_9RHOB